MFISPKISPQTSIKHMELLLSISLIFLGLGTICGGSRVSLGSELETFTSFPLNSNPSDVTNIDSIHEDKWIPGNILATIGSSVYTISPTGLPTKLTGSVQKGGLKNGVGTEARFNRTSSLVQLNGGREIIIADVFNECLRRLDRLTSAVSTFAGTCRAYNMRAQGSHAKRLCFPVRDGPVSGATFCTPTQMLYQELKNRILLLDIVDTHLTRIYSIDLTTLVVSTVFYGTTFLARGFLVDERGENYNFAVASGILEVNIQTKESRWLVGCGNETYITSECPAQSRLRHLLLKYPYGLTKYDGLYIVNDLIGDEVYIIDPKNAQYVAVCQSIYQRRCSFSPASAAVIGEYLYMGEAESVQPTVRIKRIRFSTEIYDPWSDSWLEREKITRTTSKPKYRTYTSRDISYDSKAKSSSLMSTLLLSVIGVIISFIAVGCLTARCLRRCSGNTGITGQRLVSQQARLSRLHRMRVGRPIMSVRVPHTRLRDTNTSPIPVRSSVASGVIRVIPPDAPVPQGLGTIQPFSIPTPAYTLPEVRSEPPSYSELDGISTVGDNANPPPYEE